jgi:LPS-assembly lipoprotein
VAEYDLVYTVEYQVVFPNRVPIKNKLTVSREYQDDPDQILAKSRELNLVLNELREEAADRLIRLLSSQYNSSIVEPATKAKKPQLNSLMKTIEN